MQPNPSLYHCTTWQTDSHLPFLFPGTRPDGPAREGPRRTRREPDDRAAEAVGAPSTAPERAAEPT